MRLCASLAIGDLSEQCNIALGYHLIVGAVAVIIIAEQAKLYILSALDSNAVSA